MLAIPERPMAVRLGLCFAIPTTVLSLLGGMAWAASTTPAYHISQKNQQFQPHQIAIKRGETLEIVNDDGDLLHHAYVSSAKFNFDSGDQEPGSKTDISFPVPGSFNVLCGIHPKMKLTVQVN